MSVYDILKRVTTDRSSFARLLFLEVLSFAFVERLLSRVPKKNQIN